MAISRSLMALADEELAALEYAEFKCKASDGRRVIRDERCALIAAIQLGTVTRARVAECQRVRAMWERVSS